MNILSSPLSNLNPCNTIEFDGIPPRLNRYNYEQNYLTEPSCSERNQRHAKEPVPFILYFCDKPDCCIFHRHFRFKLKAYENSCFNSSSSKSLFIAVQYMKVQYMHFTWHGNWVFSRSLYREICWIFFFFFGCYYFCNLLDKCGYNFLSLIDQIYLNFSINRI